MNTTLKVISNAEAAKLAAGKEVTADSLAYSSVLDAVWDYIADKSDSKSYATNAAKVKERQNQILQLIRSYIEQKQPSVMKNETEHMSIDELTQQLIDDITQFGVITSAYVDPQISEIQINDYQTIWVEGSDGCKILCDEVTGERVTFKDVDDCYNVIYRLLKHSKSKFSKHDTIAKGRTAEGYRVAAVHMEAAAGEKGKYQHRAASPSAVIRKFPESNFTAKDMVARGTMTAELANTVTIVPKSDVTILVVGSTGSGKTVLVQLVLNNVPSDMRIYAIENPSELGIKKYNAKGQVINNVVQYEALADSTEEDKRNASRHTEINLMMQALRMTPHYFVFGEVRYNEEINQAMVAANTGHKFVTTFHSADDAGAIRRVQNAVIAVNPGIPSNIVLEDICENIDFIFSIGKKWDRSRKMLAFTEVCGVKYNGGLAQADLNRIFEFRPERKRPGDTKLRGQHWQVNEFSPKMIDHMMSSAMDITEFDLITKPLDRDADGNVIPRSGHYDVELLLDENEVGEFGIVKAMKLLCDRYEAKGYPRPIEIDLSDSEFEQVVQVEANQHKGGSVAGNKPENTQVLRVEEVPDGDLGNRIPVTHSKMLMQEPSTIGAGPNADQVAVASAVIDVAEAMDAMGENSDEMNLDAIMEAVADSQEQLGRMQLVKDHILTEDSDYEEKK